MKRKGVNYDVGAEGRDYTTRPLFDASIAHREIEIIKSDLRCNAIRIAGTDMDRLVMAAEDALEQGLEVWLSPQIHDKIEQETLEYTVKCAEAAEMLRRQWPHLVFILGCELTLFMQGILEGDNFLERMGNPKFIENVKTAAREQRLNAFLTKATAAVREVFHGGVTYAYAPFETVDWRLFDFVCLDYYRDTRNRDSFAESLKPYFAHHKPVIITEVGLCTYQGAEHAGGGGFMIVEEEQGKMQLNGDYIRDEGLQARELTDLLTILEDTGVDGVFVFTFVAPTLTHHDEPRRDLDMASFSLVKSYADKHGTTYPEMLWEPKESFKAVADYFAGH